MSANSSENIKSKKWGHLAAQGLPKHVEFCSKCILSNQKPITSLESNHSRNDKKNTTRFVNGVCDACRWSEIKEKEIDWSERNQKLEGRVFFLYMCRPILLKYHCCKKLADPAYYIFLCRNLLLPLHYLICNMCHL